MSSAYSAAKGAAPSVHTQVKIARCPPLLSQGSFSNFTPAFLQHLHQQN